MEVEVGEGVFDGDDYYAVAGPGVLGVGVVAAVGGEVFDGLGEGQEAVYVGLELIGLVEAAGGAVILTASDDADEADEGVVGVRVSASGGRQECFGEFLRRHLEVVKPVAEGSVSASLQAQEHVVVGAGLEQGGGAPVVGHGSRLPDQLGLTPVSPPSGGAEGVFFFGADERDGGRVGRAAGGVGAEVEGRDGFVVGAGHGGPVEVDEADFGVGREEVDRFDVGLGGDAVLPKPLCDGGDVWLDGFYHLVWLSLGGSVF